MKMILRAGRIGLAVFALGAAACGGEGRDEESTLADLLKYVPADALDRSPGPVVDTVGPCLSDVQGFFRNLGYDEVPGVNEPSPSPADSLDPIEQFRYETFRQHSVLRQAGVFNEIFGFDPLRSEATITIWREGSDLPIGQSYVIWQGGRPAGDFESRLSDLGYQVQQEDGVDYYSYGDPLEIRRNESGQVTPITQAFRGDLNQVWVDDDLIAMGPDPADVVSVPRLEAEELDSLADRAGYSDVLGGMRDAYVVCFVAPSEPAKVLKENRQALQVEEVQSRYPQWGRLPVSDITALGYRYSPDVERGLTIGLWYDDQELADDSAAVLIERLEMFERAEGVKFCDEVSGAVKGNAVVVDCETTFAPATSPSGHLFFILAEDLSD